MKNKEHCRARITKKRFKGLDQPPHYKLTDRAVYLWTRLHLSVQPADQYWNTQRADGIVLSRLRGASRASPTTLDPANQNQTDDFTGFIAHSSNLALKGILGIGAMGQVATFAGNTSGAQYYAGQASSYISQWVTRSQDSSGQHLKLAYDQDGTWILKYNAFPDKLLGLNLIPSSVIQEEDSWYSGKENTYGIPLDNRHSYTKADWEMWTAASASNLQLRQFFVDPLYSFANTTSSRVPFTDWYDTISDTQNGFQARPVIGGLFSILARLKSEH